MQRVAGVDDVEVEVGGDRLEECLVAVDARGEFGLPPAVRRIDVPPAEVAPALAEGLDGGLRTLAVALKREAVVRTDDAAVLGDHALGNPDEVTQRDGVGKRLARRDDDRCLPVGQHLEDPRVEAVGGGRQRSVDVEGERWYHASSR